MKQFFSSSVRAVALFAVLTAACGPGGASDAGADAGAKPTCVRIYEACHPVDTGDGVPHSCHEFAEESATTEAACQARSAECLAACAAAADAATGDATSDASSTADSGEHDH